MEKINTLKIIDKNDLRFPTEKRHSTWTRFPDCQKCNLQAWVVWVD